MLRMRFLFVLRTWAHEAGPLIHVMGGKAGPGEGPAGAIKIRDLRCSCRVDRWKPIVVACSVEIDGLSYLDHVLPAQVLVGVFLELQVDRPKNKNENHAYDADNLEVLLRDVAALCRAF